MVVLYLLCFATLITAAPNQGSEKEETPPCGQLGSLREPRIVGGRTAFFGEIPWVVSISYSNEHFCGGTIIGKRHILSAAHCFDSPSLDSSLHRITATLGAQNLSDIDPFRTRIIGVKRVIQHEDYANDGHYLNDIAILELAEDIQWSSYIRPVCLPEEDVHSGVAATASGWGQIWSRSRLFDIRRARFSTRKFDLQYAPYSDVLKAVNLTIFDNSFCDSIYLERSTLVLLKTQLCAGIWPPGDQEMDTAKGDSGGPLSVLLNGRWIIAGVTSSATKFTAPAIYTRVTSFLRWIKEKTSVTNF